MKTLIRNGRVVTAVDDSTLPMATGRVELTTKSCNRCGRYLPINFPGERNHLSFSNHCTRNDLLPCKHGSFGTLKQPDTNETLRLTNGFQLECRFCKRYTVNGQLNPQRSAAQMKEDAHRRRGFELLLAELYGANEHLLRHGGATLGAQFEDASSAAWDAAMADDDAPPR